MAIQPASSAVSPNVHAWRYALLSACALLVAAFVVLFVAFSAPYAALTCVGPLALGAGLVGVTASHLRLRLPFVAYPVLVLGIASAVNAPVLGLIL